jgi:hypothetical protein
MLAHATAEMGRGWGFGLHEALDQTGAMVGPLLLSAMLHAKGRYPPAFTALLVPAILSLAALLTARRLYPRPRDLEVAVPKPEAKGIQGIFWPYLAAAALMAIGYADSSLIAYHFAKQGVMPPPIFP